MGLNITDLFPFLKAIKTNAPDEGQAWRVKSYLNDGAGNAITSTANALNVNISSGGSAITNDGTFATPTKQDTTNTEIGIVTETSPATDTASSGLNGRLQRIAQRITSLISLVPSFWASGTLQFRSLTVNNTAVAIKASSGSVLGWNVINLHSSTIYIKIYNIAAASVNPASDVPTRTLMVPANGSIFLEPHCIVGNYSTAISVRAVTDTTDTGTTSPATLPIIEIMYI